MDKSFDLDWLCQHAKALKVCFYTTKKIVHLSSSNYLILNTKKVEKIKTVERSQYQFKTSYPSTLIKGAPNLRAHAPLYGIKLHAPLTRRKVQTSRSKMRLRKQTKFTLFAVNILQSYTGFFL